MVLKWVTEEGEFSYDYKWLSNKPRNELISGISEDFKQMFGIYPDELKILKDDLTEVI
ncbi:hypothetical protein [Dyadobacter sp. 3J3]|uniref:hypothetical protein n=1 Tax=Dyadobacter sp. 3J3 TaxID=2606600 RepID=UPI00135C87E5|nr:hypothetical protein [Dyadobacter sp. 3J3]